jgi:hypothetical protein
MGSHARDEAKCSTFKSKLLLLAPHYNGALRLALWSDSGTHR